MLGPVGIGVGLWGRGGKNEGLELLKGALGWFSAQSQTVVTRTSAPATPGATNSLTVLTGQADPWGGTTAVAYQSTAAVAAHWGRWDSVGLASGEEWTVSTWIKPNSTSNLSNKVRFFVNATTTGVDFNVRRSTSEVFALYSSGTGAVRTRIEEKEGGWFYCELTFVSDGSTAHYFCLDGNSSVLGSGTTDLYMTPPVFTRNEVSAMANLGGGAAVCSQATAASRPYARPLWGALLALAFDGKASSLGVTAVPAAWSGAGTALSFGVVLEPVKASTARGTAPTEGAIFKLIGATASLELRLTSAGVLTMRLTDDATTATVATLPITALFTKQVLYVVRNGTSVQLYVQGVALGAAQTIGAGAATFTACTIGGTTLLANVAECAFHAGALTAQQVSQASSYLATRSGFSTSPIPLFLGVSQSNGLENCEVAELPYASQAPSAFSMLRTKTSADTLVSTWDWGPIRPRIPDGTSGYAGRAYSINCLAGATYTWGMSQQLGRVALCHFGKGGTAIGEFLSAGSLWAEQLAFFQDAVADLVAGGIPYYIAGLVNVHGENDSGSIVLADAFPGKLNTLRQDLETALGVSIPAIIIPRVSNLLTTAGSFPERDRTRANLLTWQAADPATRILIDIDNLPLKPDETHWTSTTCLEAGKRIGARFPRAA